MAEISIKQVTIYLGTALVQSYPCNFALPADTFFMRGGKIG